MHTYGVYASRWPLGNETVWTIVNRTGYSIGKFWLVADAVRYRRSDTALVRVIVPARGGDLKTATDIGVAFIQVAFPVILRQMPL